MSARRRSDQFVALPVGQGDCFYYRTNDVTVLVDGGKSLSGAVELFRHYELAREVDVLVCTHNDADHANGVLGLLRSEFPCKEVWLPSSWTHRLEDLLTNPQQFVAELGREIRERSAELPDTPEKHVLEWIASRHLTASEDQGTVSEEHLNAALESALDSDEWPVRSYPLLPLHDGSEIVLVRLGFPQSALTRLLTECLAAASRIAEIAKAAYERGTRIRWFQVGIADQLPPRPTDVLRGVNCGEIVRAGRGGLSALAYLALSVANKRSLVFQTRRVGCPGVLFSADSDLSFDEMIRWDEPLIITAPHHGSEHNAAAYARFRRENTSSPDKKIWVRSDGRFQSRPGASYLSMPIRYCTRCRDQVGPSRPVAFETLRGRWQIAPTNPCACAPRP
jgi:hypothetical protein